MYVRWSGILSHGFHVANGVRQGGILSPYLFNVYMDDLSIALSACSTGCCVSNTIIVQQPSRHFPLNLAKIPPNQVIADFGRGSSVESESE